MKASGIWEPYFKPTTRVHSSGFRCFECGKEVECKIVSGKTIYPHRPDLYSFKFIRHSACGNYTGYYQGEHPTLPSKHIR